MTHTIVFIHGMYMNPLCWEHWIEYFQSKGYQCLAPAWPGRDQPIDVLRSQHPDPQLGRLTLSDVISQYADVVKSLPEKPVLIGHSMGGLVVQLMLQNTPVAAGVAIDSAPPMGILTTKWSFLKSNWPHVNPFVPQGNPIEMTFSRFQYTFVNGLSLNEQRAAFERYVVPESRRVPRQSLTAKVNFKQVHLPLLMIAGSADHLIPASLNRANYRRYQPIDSLITFKEFPGRNHFILGQPGWEEIAGYIFTWLNEKGV